VQLSEGIFPVVCPRGKIALLDAAPSSIADCSDSDSRKGALSLCIPNNYGELVALSFLKRCLLRDQWLWRPVINQFIDLLEAAVKSVTMHGQEL
jgi:hypothetical protein